MNTLIEKQIVEHLKSCSPAQLIRILAPVLAERGKADSILEERLALCKCLRHTTPLPEDPPWTISAVGCPPNPEEWTNHASGGYWESGDCERCGMDVSSYGKEAVCPLCGTTVHLT